MEMTILQLKETYIKYISQAVVKNTEKAKGIGE